MKRLLFLVLSCLLFSLNIGAQFEDLGLKARFYEGRFFIYASDQELAKKVGYRARKIYEKVAKDIGHSGAYKTRYQMLIWRDREGFLEFLNKYKINVPFDGLAAVAIHKYNDLPTVAGYLDKNLFKNNLPHEFTHLILEELLDVQGKDIPLWLNEGLATYEGGPPLKYVRYFLRTKIKQGDFIKLSELVSIKEYPPDATQLKLFYSEAQCFMVFLLETKEKRKLFPLFLKWYVTSGHSFQKAYLYSYGGTSKIKNIEKKWINYIMRD